VWVFGCVWVFGMLAGEGAGIPAHLQHAWSRGQGILTSDPSPTWLAGLKSMCPFMCMRVRVCVCITCVCAYVCVCVCRFRCR
jgi:hypothetical protein